MSRCIHVVAAALLTLYATGTSAQTRQGRPLQAEDYYRVKSIGNILLSPNEEWVAFTVSTRIEDQTNGSASEVWLVSASGDTPAIRVSTPGVNAGSPVWMDDGRLRFNTPSRTIAVAPVTPARPDTLGPAGRAGGAGNAGRGAGAGITSPDNRWVATVRNMPVVPRARPQLTDFERRHEDLFRGVIFDWLDFHRDGAPFPVPNTRDPELSPPQEIFLAAAGSTDARQLTQLGLRPVGVQWLRDGRSLIFSADSMYRNERVYGRTDVWNLALDGTLTRLTPNDELDYNGARISPDGRWILCTRNTSTDAIIAKKMSHGGPVDLVVIPAAGGAERVLTADWDYLPATPQWSPDGKHVYFTGGIGGTTHLFRVSPDSGAVEQITRGERDISGITFSRSFTKIVFTVGRFETPPEIHIANIDGTGEKQLTHVHDEFTREVALSRAERLKYNSADGTEIEGWLLFPHDYDVTRGPYPLVVNNHGGPHSAIQYGFNFKNQYFAANGYFVLEVNFRSSTGYGEKFLWGTWGAWGNRDGEDVMAGIDHVLARLPIDRDRVATMGHSYGGFMTNWLITQYPDRFAAAISGAGIANWISDWGNADISRTKETEFFGPPWDARAREIMIRQSPITYADRAKAPTLFINGEIDKRVPYSENEQMIKALLKNGVPARMVQYADQPHAISGSFNIVHRMLTERRWLDEWLKKPRGSW